MEDAGFRQYVHATQHRVGPLHGRVGERNDRLRGAQSARAASGAVATQQIPLAASACDVTYRAVRAMADMGLQMRTMPLRVAEEPAIIEAAHAPRDALRNALGTAHRAAGERPRWRVVPPDGDD